MAELILCVADGGNIVLNGCAAGEVHSQGRNELYVYVAFGLLIA
jgi:hypothetical protein